MNEKELRQLFKNSSDCYADTNVFDEHGFVNEGEVIQAMTEDRFVETVMNMSNTPVGPSVAEQTSDYQTTTIQRLRDYHESEDGKKAFTEFAEKLEREETARNNQIERIGRIIDLPAFIEKVVAKYSSTEYRDRWYDRGIEPPDDLSWVLFGYAEKYGRECSDEEWDLYGNVFTSALFFCQGYYLNMMVGQGSVIRICKQ